MYPTGRKVCYLQYRNKLKSTRKIKIGLHGNITTERARDIAQQLALKVAAGLDPANQIADQKLLPTLGELCHEYIELHVKVNKKLESGQNDIAMIEKTIMPTLGHKKLEEISSHDLQKLHRDLKETPYKANRVRSLLSKMFSLAIEWGWHSENPALFIKKYHEEKRTRWLDNEEMSRLWEALDAYHNSSVSVALKLLLLTGARKNEVLSATWKQFDLNSGVWTKPSHMTKQNREEFLPLSLEAIELLNSWKKRSASDFVFLGKIEGQPDVSTFLRTHHPRASGYS